MGETQWQERHDTSWRLGPRLRRPIIQAYRTPMSVVGASSTLSPGQKPAQANTQSSTQSERPEARHACMAHCIHPFNGSVVRRPVAGETPLNSREHESSCAAPEKKHTHPYPQSHTTHRVWHDEAGGRPERCNDQEADEQQQGGGHSCPASRATPFPLYSPSRFGAW